MRICSPAGTAYRPRQPADTLLYRVVQNHLETFLALCRKESEAERMSAHAEHDLRRFLERGILANGFARARCDDCGYDFRITFSCKGRPGGVPCVHHEVCVRDYSASGRSRPGSRAGAQVCTVRSQAAVRPTPARPRSVEHRQSFAKARAMV